MVHLLSRHLLLAARGIYAAFAVYQINATSTVVTCVAHDIAKRQQHIDITPAASASKNCSNSRNFSELICCQSEIYHSSLALSRACPLSPQKEGREHGKIAPSWSARKEIEVGALVGAQEDEKRARVRTISRQEGERVRSEKK